MSEVESDSDSDSEPTMEEILASIRKIISEDEPEGGAAEGAAAEATVEDEGEGEEGQPLELTQMVGDDGNVVDLRGPQQAAAPEAGSPPQEPPAAAAAETPPEAAGETAEAETDTDIDLEAEESVPMADDPAPAQEVPADAEPADPGGLVSATTAAMATSAMAKISENAEGDSPVTNLSGGDRTIEALVREALAAHLKDWLDANLPDLVETVVREEIQKMVKRAEYR